MENTLHIENKIAEFVQMNTHTDLKKINSSTLLFKEGVFDSMAFVLLIDYIEESFSIKPADEDLVEENFESVDAITRYILRKTAVNIS
jgi:acyl carrier protein